MEEVEGEDDGDLRELGEVGLELLDAETHLDGVDEVLARCAPLGWELGKCDAVGGDHVGFLKGLVEL